MKKILIVDDEKETRILLKDVFDVRGFNCLVAQDGLEAIKIAQKEHPSLIILDLIMPNMDGIETYKVLKADTGTKHIPIIVFTAQDSEIVSKKGVEEVSDVLSFVLKPFNMRELISIVEKALTHPKK